MIFNYSGKFRVVLLRLLRCVNYKDYMFWFWNGNAEQGSSPVWNERFTFRAEYPGSGEQYKVTLKIMDKDTFTADDYIGEASYVIIFLYNILFNQ